jgi:DNA invertase Pin-like site-specific DNA recombinase
MEFDKEFEEYASGKDEQGRPVFLECLEFVSKGDELYFQDLSRAGRNALELQTTVGKLIARGVKVVFISEGLTFVGEGGDQMAQAISTLLLSMLSAVNQLFLTQNSVAVKQGLARAKAEGRLLGGASPEWAKSFKANKELGLHKKNKSSSKAKLRNEPIIAEVKNMVKYSKDSLNLTEIACNLNEKSMFTSTGKLWSKSSISRLVKNNEIQYQPKNRLTK